MAINVRYFARALGLQTANLVIPTVDGGAGRPAGLRAAARRRAPLDTSQTDIFDQLSDPKVDVLWVVDDSGSMAPYQDELAANFSQFFIASNVQRRRLPHRRHHDAHGDGELRAATCRRAATDADCGAGGQCLATLCTAGTQVNSCDDDPMSGYYTSCMQRALPHAGVGQRRRASSSATCRYRPTATSNPSRPASDSAEGGLRAAYKFLSPPNITDPAINGGFLRDDAKLHVIMVATSPSSRRARSTSTSTSSRT